MPDWGLTEEQRETEPWGLPSEVLRPGKVITDPVHGDIALSWLEVTITDSAAFQRLRRVRQLGTTHLVYPGATHTRFSHSIGTVRMAQALLNQAITQGEGLHKVPDLVTQWRDEVIPARPETRKKLERRIAEATVLARLGALLHDLCHVPVGHSVEDDLRILEAHDENIERFEGQWADVRSTVLRAIKDRWVANRVDQTLLGQDGKLYAQLVPLIISKQRRGNAITRSIRTEEMDYPFVADIVGNTICADLLDYLQRDHMFTGLPASLGERFTNAFFIVPDGRGPYSQRMALNIQRDGHERSDIVSELLKALRYRYELSERALAHHAKLAADAMVGEALERWEAALWLKRAGDEIEDLPDATMSLETLDIDTLRGSLDAKYADFPDGENVAKAVRAAVRKDLETEFLSHGDDGLFEHMTTLGAARGGTGITTTQQNQLLDQAAWLAEDLLNRRLFRIAARIGFKDADADRLFEEFGKASARSGLEREAEAWAGIGGPGRKPQVVIWLPEQKMRTKHAEVLVQHPAGVSSFYQYESGRSGRGSDIYAAHPRLWGCYVYVSRDVSDDDADVVTTYLARRMGVRWERHREKFGDRPDEWPTRLAVVRTLADRRDGPEPNLDVLVRDASTAAARGAGTFAALLDKVAEQIPPDLT
jgi:HD superfamily phosphohydrolase